MYIIRVYDDTNNGSDGSNDKALVIKSIKNQAENVSEAPPLSNSGKRKRRGNDSVSQAPSLVVMSS